MTIYKTFQDLHNFAAAAEVLNPVETFADIPDVLGGEIYVPPEPEPE